MTKNEKNLEQALLSDPDLYFIKRDVKSYGWTGVDYFGALYDLEKVRCGIYHTFLEPNGSYLDNLENYRNVLFECYNQAYERFKHLQRVEERFKKNGN